MEQFILNPNDNELFRLDTHDEEDKISITDLNYDVRDLILNSPNISFSECNHQAKEEKSIEKYLFHDERAFSEDDQLDQETDNYNEKNTISNSISADKSAHSKSIKINTENPPKIKFNQDIKQDNEDNSPIYKIKGNLIETVQTLNGSKNFQVWISQVSQCTLKSILSNMLKDLPKLMKHVYANYFCQKLFIALNSDLRKVFLDSVKSHLIEVSVDKIGTFSLQRIIEKLEDIESQVTFTNYILDLSSDDFSKLCFVSLVYLEPIRSPCYRANV